MIEQLIFYVFAFITVMSALMVISARNPVYGALFLVSAFVSSAVLWVLLEMEFLALALIFVYVGAVMTLFLFVVMMLNIHVEPLKRVFTRYTPIGILISVAVLALMIYILIAQHFSLEKYPIPAPQAMDFSNVKAIGAKLYTFYMLPFEVASILLLTAIVAAISLAMPKRRERHRQDPGKQVLVKRDDRIRLVDDM